MKNSIPALPIRTSPGWLPVVVSSCIALAGLVLAVATAADLIGWQ